MDPHERATSVWSRVAGLRRRKDPAIDIIAPLLRRTDAVSKPEGR